MKLIPILILLFCLVILAVFSACGSSSLGSGSSSSLLACSTTETVSAADIEVTEQEKCATVSILENVGDVGGSEQVSVKEYFAAELQNTLTRARVYSSKDATDVAAFDKWKQFFDYSCSSGESCSTLTMDFYNAYANADIAIGLTYYVVDGTYNIFAAAQNMYQIRMIGRWTATATADSLISVLTQLGQTVSEGIKDEIHCFKMTPKAVTIDYNDPQKRSKTFTTTVKNLKNENADIGMVSFSLANDAGTLSAASVAVSGGAAETVFTMTRRRTNTLTATYSSDTEKPKEVKSAITPLCGFIIVIDGTRTFTVNQQSLANAGFEEGSWWSYLGSSTVSGNIPLDDLEETPGEVTGEGWYKETQSASVSAHFIVWTVDMAETIECELTGSETGASEGGWTLWGTRTNDTENNTASVQAISLGQSDSGRILTGSCPGINVGGSSSFATLALFRSVEIALEAGATATVTGNDGVSDYSYNLSVKYTKE